MASENQASPASAIASAAAAVAGNADEDVHETDAPETANSNVVDEADDGDAPPPAYGQEYGSVSNDDSMFGLGTQAVVGDDGRVNINIDQRSRRLSNLLVPALRSQLDLVDKTPIPPPYTIPSTFTGQPDDGLPPRLNVVIHVVGSRGDVQPFVALGKVLKDTYKHRVRLATHPVFKDFVTENGLEFFNIGGDPAELMAFMVKNPGLMPGFDTLRSGDVGKRRKEIGQMIKGCWRSCIEAGDGMGPEANDDTTEDWMAMDKNADLSGLVDNMKPQDRPFVADAIIANPPSFAHVHCAEKLGCPLHIMFTMPYSPTQAFPHPLANIQSSNADTSITNFMSYGMVDMMTWQGLGDVVNRFRQKSLGLEPVSMMWAPGMVARLRVPHTYCWSPALIPKPKDWANFISISGFYFLSLASNYTPAPDLQAFLDNGPPPVYIGFGSIVVEDPTAMTKMIFDAVRKTGQRALVSKGWGGIGADELGIPDDVFMLGNVPHDWLFKHVSCVVHHGGAGTTAAGIACGKPTVIVPFFGDQPFWGAMVAKAGAGPEPIAYKQLNADKLAESIMTALKPESLERAKELAASISHEKGTDQGAQTFHQFLEVDSLRCVLAPRRAAVWRLKRTNVRLSSLAATVLGNEGLLDFKDLKLFRAREYDIDDGPWDPISGGASAILGTITSMMMGFADFPVETMKALNVHPDAKKKVKGKESDQNPKDQPPTEQTASSSQSSESPTPNSSAPSEFNFGESLDKIRTPTQDRQEGDRNPKGGNSVGTTLRDQLTDQIQQHSSSRSDSSVKPGTGDKPKQQFNLADAIDTGKGVSRILSAGFKSPMDFTHSLAKGFHNAPKLYGDDTVRKPEKITDFKSGIAAASKEFGFGFYDGITGLVTQPMEGLRKEGAAGFIKGVGKGFGGIVFKPGAAIFALPGYTMKGVYKELQAQLGSSVQNYIIAARTAQGFADLHYSQAAERAEIIEKWQELQQNLKKKKNPDEVIREFVTSQSQKQKGRLVQGAQSLSGRGSTGVAGKQDSAKATAGGTDGDTVSSSHRQAASSSGTAHDNDAELERAIHESVAQTSKGNPEEDAMIERAIRASVLELQHSKVSSGHGDVSDDEESDAIAKAMAASLAEAKRFRDEHGEGKNDAEFEEALKVSMAEHARGYSSHEGGGVHEEEEFDEKMGGLSDDDDNDELQRAVKASQEDHQNESKQRTEEEIVMEYVKKQSLMEEQLRQARAGR